jgi:phospholipid/cholesterol/gamma-HCH transport system substrate-binding protein
MNRPNHKPLLSNFQIGLIAVLLTFFGFYLAFTKSIPFISGGGYELKAVFADAQNVRAKSPVRIAGVQVGEVTEVNHVVDENGDGQDAAVVTMKLKDDALPVRQDATLQLRPRLFLEGNLFVDLHPGSPGAPELDSGSIVPEGQTASSVQFDQVLTSLQAPVRDNLQIFLKEFGDALDKYGGGEGFQETFRTSPAAFRYTAEVNEALLGTQPGDLAGFVSNLNTVVSELDQNSTELQGLISNLNTVSGDFAAHQESLRNAIVELPRALAAGRPALFKLNRDFPALRAFAREALPGVKSANKALDYANPWIGQVRQLISQNELRGLVDDLRPTIPDLASLSSASLPFLEQVRALSSCFNHTVIPWSETPVPNQDGDPPAKEVFKEFAYGLVGVAGESRSGDANGQEFRVLGAGSANTIAPFPTPDLAQPLTGVVPFPLLGAQPAIQSSAKTPFHPDDPCENQDPPDLHSEVGDVPDTSPSPASATAASPQLRDLQSRYREILSQLTDVKQLKSAGDRAAAKDLLSQVLDQYAGWSKDWQSLQQSVGLKLPLPKLELPKGLQGVPGLEGVGG